ncbi:bromodomain adjacent to zinc finger domain protein 1A [Abrus precatorius]|uniref:Bromodomain adjacent to zinc finger domain protein 1A n=1 Tax=Abrus precatorius TaxID=3816 RepID=A0A8B8MAV5_ABRPR|nr:bromodomain adjacent to zinc finger domain protein 1A [Abrus precatorius]
MVRGGKVSGKRNFRKSVQSKEGGSDDSDEDYVVSDEGREASDYYCSSLDGCTSEESIDSFMEEEEEEEEEFKGLRNVNRSKAKKSSSGRRKNASKKSRKRGKITHAEEEEEEDEEIQERGRITRAEQLEEEEEEEWEEKEEEEVWEEKEEEWEQKEEEEGKEKEEVEWKERKEKEAVEKEEEEKVERDGDEEEEEQEEDGDGDEEDEDFDYDDEDDEFTPEEEDFSDEEEEIRGEKRKNNGMRVDKKVLQKRTSSVSTRGRKRRSSRASKKPLRNKLRKNGKLKKKERCDDGGDFIDNGPAIRTTSWKKRGRKRRRVLLSDSDYASTGSSDFEYTISEEEREQVREAKELCGVVRNNLRSSSHLINNEEVGVHEDLHQQRKPPGRKGKEKIEEPQGKKGKEKVEDLKGEVGKQVCGICLSEEDKRRVRGVLNCCTHYFCFACIMEWAKVESRCPLCKQRFKTISKPARSTTGIDLREVMIQVPERDQVYQPTEEELRSYIDPYEYVICSECHQGGDDGLMLLCDICDSPAHTYCVGLGREVPEGNWYCEGCRPVALGSSSSQIQEGVADSRVTIQSLPVRSPPVLHVRESIDLNLISSPRTVFNQGLGPLSSSRFPGRSVEGVSPVSGGAPTLSGRRWIHRQIQQLLSMDRMTSTAGRSNSISATTSTSNFHSSQIDQSRETATQHTRTQDVGTSYHTFFDERLCNNNSPLMQNGTLWPELTGTPPVPDCEQVHQFSRSNIVTDGSLSPVVREETNFHIAKEQLQSMVKSHLKSMSQNIDLGHNTFKDVTRSSMHTILAACGLEHKKSEVCTVPTPSVCPHIELMAGGQTSLIKGCCSSCFDSFVGDVVKRILDTRISSQWLRLGL